MGPGTTCATPFASYIPRRRLALRGSATLAVPCHHELIPLFDGSTLGNAPEVALDLPHPCKETVQLVGLGCGRRSVEEKFLAQFWTFAMFFAFFHFVKKSNVS